MTITSNRSSNASAINRFREIKKGLPKIDRLKFQKVCRMPIDKFSEYGKRYDPPGGKPYFFKDNGSDILAVFHADYVDSVKPSHFTPANLSHDTIYFCPTLDDRAGAYVILHLLPELGINYDILITTGEESLESSAQYFTPPEGKKYNWMFSFDRAGTDVVMYQYFSHDCEKLLRRNAWMCGEGTYSDIRELESLKCKGFNFGVGYHDQHTMNCYLSEKELMWNVKRFVMFYKENATKLFKHTPKYNVYIKDKGFGFLESTRSNYFTRDNFTDSDIDLLEALEQNDFPFPASITKEDLEKVFREMRGEELNEIETLTSKSNDIIEAVAATEVPPKELPIEMPMYVFNTGILNEDNNHHESQELSKMASEFSPVQDLVTTRDETKSAIIVHSMIGSLNAPKSFGEQHAEIEVIEEIKVDQVTIGHVGIVPQGRLERDGKAKRKETYQKVGPGGSWVWCLERQDGTEVRIDSIVQVNGREVLA